MKKLLIVAVLFFGLIGCGALVSGGDDADTSASTEATATPEADEATDAEPEKSEPEFTTSQEQAIAAAENYLDTMPFSKQGLIQQLSSPAGSDFPRKDAVFAVNHVDVDWNAEAVEAAQGYLDTMPFSRAGLIEQLESKAGSGFTHAQAVYAVNKVGL